MKATAVLLPLLAAALLAGPARAAVTTGLEAAAADDFAMFAGKRVGLVTNQTGVDASGRSGVDAMFASRKAKLVAIFSPEHGFRGNAADGEVINNSTDPVTGLPIYSLYGKTHRPTSAMLAGIDVLVFDIQDVGARFYTYLTTMALCMEEAAKRKIPFVVLDRPNPISGLVMEGPVLARNIQDFTGYFPVPVRHGMTAGEVALLHKDLRGIAADLTVVKLRGWDRASFHGDTGLPWVNPSPNIRGVDAAIMYPGIGAFESTNMAVGRGTDAPFLWFGAPWLDAERLVNTLNAAGLPGVRFRAESKTPEKDIYAGRLCRGVRMEITDRAAVRPMDIFVLAVCALRDKAHYRDFRFDEAALRLTAGNNVYKAIFESRETPEQIMRSFREQCLQFDKLRAPYLLY
ncbi:MAG: exo-beta-N-acetylmuramidase NamZ family protein [Elusimicrobiales bacterium]